MRAKYFTAGLLLALSLGALAQVSGVPQRLRLQSLGVGTAAPAAGNITATGSITTNTSRDLGYSSGNYTGTVVGCTTNPAPFIVWHKIGGHVSLQMQPFSCTSNSLSFTITGAPVAIRPSSNSNVQLQHCINNTVNAPGSCEMYMGPSGTLSISYLGSTFTSSGTKGLGFSGGNVGLNYSTNW